MMRPKPRGDRLHARGRPSWMRPASVSCRRRAGRGRPTTPRQRQSVGGDSVMADQASIAKRLGAEFIGTFWLVLGGCGSAVLAAAFPTLGIGFAGVALAFGLTVLTMAYAVGHISGCHLNPAVSLGLVAGKRFPASELLPYVVAQVLGGIAGAAVLYLIASGKEGFSVAGGFASNGFGAHSPG